MKKPVIIVAAFIALAFSSCQKPTSNSNYTCNCSFLLVTGVYSRDTTETTNYPAGTSSSDARTNCTNQGNTLISTGQTTAGATAPCTLSAH